MANLNVRGLIGFNPSSGTSRLLAAYENDVVNVATGTGYSLNFTNTTNDVEFAIFMDSIFLQNGIDQPRNFDKNNNRWVSSLCTKMPISKYIKSFKSRLFLGYCTIPYVTTESAAHAWDDDPMEVRYTDSNTVTTGAVFPSRVFFSDLPKSKSALTWGLYWTRLLGSSPLTDILTQDIQLANSPGVPKKTFTGVNIKVGDPLTLVDFSNSVTQFTSDLKFLTTKVDSAYKFSIDKQTTGIRGDTSAWIGSNWFDVSPDDGDVITGFGENSNRLLIFKLLSLYVYTGSSLTKVQGAPGTSYNRSVINDKYGNTYYFHGSDPNISGIYKYNGVSSVLISRGIAPFIKGMSASNYTAVVAWAEGNELRWYLGNLTNTNYDISMTNAVATYNVDTGAWSVDPIADVITASTQWIVSNVQSSYLGTNDSQVLIANSGNSHNGTAIPATLETKIFYPAGSEIICKFPTVQVIGRFTKGVRVKYKLWGIPTNNQKYSTTDSDWWSLGELEGDLTEFPLPIDHQQGAGIQFKFDESGTVENDWYIEKISLFYRPDRTRLL